MHYAMNGWRPVERLAKAHWVTAGIGIAKLCQALKGYRIVSLVTEPFAFANQDPLMEIRIGGGDSGVAGGNQRCELAMAYD